MLLRPSAPTTVLSMASVSKVISCLPSVFLIAICTVAADTANRAHYVTLKLHDIIVSYISMLNTLSTFGVMSVKREEVHGAPWGNVTFVFTCMPDHGYHR